MMEITENDIFRLLENQATICRFCFHIIDDTQDSYSLFEDDLSYILEFCCEHLLLSDDIVLPDRICSTCHFSLQNTYKFLTKVNSSHNILKTYVKNQKSERSLESLRKAYDEDTQPDTASDCERTEIIGIFNEADNVGKCLPKSNNPKLKQSKHVKNISAKKGSRIKRNKARKKVEICRNIVQRNYNCSSCNKNYKSNFELEVHLRTHSGERPFTCTVCGKTFIDNRNLRRHEKIHTGNKEHECPICHKEFLHLFSLKTHERIHRSEKPYVCEICGKLFNTSGELRVHCRTHTKERPYKCSLCGKAFSSKAALNIHTRIHTGDKRYACRICDRKCRTASDLKVHMRCHNNEKPYLCKYANCDKRYKNSSQLNVHLRTHTGEKPHQCMVCYRKFGESNTLKRHVVTHQKNT